MKKEDFLAEVAKIYFRANNYLELFSYLESGNCAEVINAQLATIRVFDKNDLWQKVNAENVMKHLKSIEKYVEKQEKELALKFMSLNMDGAEFVNLKLWFTCMTVLMDFATNGRSFLLKVVAFFEKHLRCFEGEQYWQLLELLVAHNMDETVIKLSNQLNIGYDLSAHLIIQIFDAKYHRKF